MQVLNTEADTKKGNNKCQLPIVLLIIGFTCTSASGEFFPGHRFEACKHGRPQGNGILKPLVHKSNPPTYPSPQGM